MSLAKKLATPRPWAKSVLQVLMLDDAVEKLRLESKELALVFVSSDGLEAQVFGLEDPNTWSAWRGTCFMTMQGSHRATNDHT
jgi:hypothetical protein